MPGFKSQLAEVARDSSKWHEAMQQAREEIKEFKRQQQMTQNATGAIM